MSNNVNFDRDDFNLNKDVLKSFLVHGIIVFSFLIIGVLQRLILPSSSGVVTGLNSKQNNNLNLEKPVINASLVEKKFIEEAIKRQNQSDHSKMMKEKRLEQQEQQLAKLKKIAEQEKINLKQEAENIKKEAEKNKQAQEQIKKQQQLLQQTKEQLKQQAIKLEQEKLQKLESQQLAEKKNSQITENNQVRTENSVNNLNLNQQLGSTSDLNNKSNPLSLGSGNGSPDSMGGRAGIQNIINNQLAAYQAKWKADIISNRKRVSLFPTNISCWIRIKLFSDGKLALVKVEKSSGNLAYDSFSEQAIYRSEPFEMPSDPVINKEITEIDHLFEFDDSEFNEV